MNGRYSIWPDSREATQELLSFDGGVSAACAVQRPEQYAFFHSANHLRGVIGRGAGLSYAAASFGDGDGDVSVELTRFDRVLGFDEATGVVEVEAGIRLGTLFEFLADRGYYLSAQPGHGSISIGGCVAADVHGKNQARDGTFIRQVASLLIFHPTHGLVLLSSEENSEIFRATCGGFGLTGLIVKVRLQARPIPSSVVNARWAAVDSLAEGAKLLRVTAQTSDFAYSWHDLSRPGKEFERGYVRSGVFVPMNDVIPHTRRRHRHSTVSSAWRARLPMSLVNPISARLINSTHRWRYRNGTGNYHTTLAKIIFPIHGAEAYFRLYGRRGFQEYQALVPHHRFDEYMAGVRMAARRRRVVLALASGKHFAGVSDLLRFCGDGICFSINVPRSPRSIPFFADLDKLIVEVGGKPNIIKDSRLPRSVVEATYPETDRLRSLLRSWDPDRLFRSELSARLGL